MQSFMHEIRLGKNEADFLCPTSHWNFMPNMKQSEIFLLFQQNWQLDGRLGLLPHTAVWFATENLSRQEWDRFSSFLSD